VLLLMPNEASNPTFIQKLAYATYQGFKLLTTSHEVAEILQLN